MTAVNKIGNEYADAAEKMMPKASKAVWQAIAVSFAFRLQECDGGAAEVLAEEWDALHANGIVPQRRRR